MEREWKTTHGRTDPKNRKCCTGCHLQQVCISVWCFASSCHSRCMFKITFGFVLIFLLRDVRQMLLKLVELRSSDWGRVRAPPAASNATPDNDPNYFMVSVNCTIPSIFLFLFFIILHFYTLCIPVLSWFYIFPLRMNLHSTQKTVHLLQQQTQVRLCKHVHSQER